MLLIDLEKCNLEGQSFNTNLDDVFFKDFGGDITGGSVLAQITCDKIVEDSFHFIIHAAGHVFTPCDRCLDDVELRINIDDDIVVRLGDEEIDNGDVLVVDRYKPVVNMDQLICQLIIVSLPIQRVHEPGMCNNAMMKVMNLHQVARSNDGDLNNDLRQPSDNDENSHYDERWEKLKNLFNK